MKKTICIIITLLAALISLYSQDRNYFKNNILDLDPIEGIYDVDSYKQGANAFRTFPEHYEGSSKITIKRIGENKFSFNDRPNEYIERVGETNVYNYWNRWDAAGWVKTRFYLQNSGRTFEWEFEVPDAQLRSDLGRDYQYGIRVMFRISAIKEYPTSSMYLEAYEEAIRIEQEQKRQQEIEASKPTEWGGSGFALNNGYLVTNYHVIEDAKSIIVKGVKGNFSNAYNAEIVATDKYNDLALLKINDSRFTGFGTIPYKVKTSISDVGEDIFVLGYPLTSTMGDEIKLTTGVISSKTGFQGDVSLYQMSAPVQPGNSGGPLFDGKGNLIGIVSSKHIGTEGVGYAIKALYLKNLVESAVSSSIIPANNTISGQALTGKVKAVKNYVFMIECSSIANSFYTSNSATYSTPTNNQTNGNRSSSTASAKPTNPAPSSNASKNIFIWPKVGYASKGITVKRVYLDKDETIVTLEATGFDWISISKDTYLQTNGSNYSLIKATGITYTPERTTCNQEKVEFALCFKPIPKDTKSFHLVENVQNGINVFSIELK